MTNFVSIVMRMQDRLEEWVCYVSAFAVAVMMVITTVEVIGRSIFYASVPGSYEYVSLLFVYLIYLGLAYSQRRDAHITISLVYDYLPRKARQIVQGAFLLIAMVFFAVLTVTSADSTLSNYVLGDTVLGTIEIETWWARAGVPVGCGLLALRFLTQFLRLATTGELYEEEAARQTAARAEAEQVEDVT